MPREIIRSKYFCKQVMEESLSDFQETKTKCIGPKIIKKTKPRAKPKKRVKGQKDIRTLIQKKNELVTFTKDFNNVCTKSGIDIDSQELQLAIALSKSLHDQSKSEAGTSQSNKTLTSQERTNQIRRTLQEYGFKVPEAKIKSEANKQVKKYKKQYKLLLITEEERREKISDKYSQILFQYPGPEDFYENDNGADKINKGLYQLCTNISYNLMKNNDIYYIPDILQEITVNKGSLLRDWSDIPGRPCSPVLIRDTSTSISDIDCTQTELNTILSGTVAAAKEVFNSKIRTSFLKNINCETESGQSNKQCDEQNKDTICDRLLIKPEEEIVNESKDVPINKLENSTEQTEITMLSCKDRSLSPDLFGDDASSVIDNTIYHNHSNIATSKLHKTTDNTEILDLTEPPIINLAELHYLPETSDVTKRKSNDFMDLTECVTTSSQKDKTHLILQSTKTCESKVIYDDCMEITECINPSSLKCNDNVNTVTNVETHIDLVTENDCFMDKKEVTSFDLTQSSNSDDELPMVNIHGSQKSMSSDTIIVDYDDYGQFSNNEDIIELNTENVDIEKTNSECYPQDVPEQISDNKQKSMLVGEVNDNNTNDPLEINIDLTKTSENGAVKKNDYESFIQDVPEQISDNKHKSMLVGEVNENNSNDPLEISDIDLTQTLENGDIEKNSSVSFIQVVSQDYNHKSMPVDKENINNSKDILETSNIDLIHSSENGDIEKNNFVSFTQDASQHMSDNNNKDKSMLDEEVNKNNSYHPSEISNIDLTQSPDNVNIEKNNFVSCTQDLSEHIFDNKDKSISIEKLNENNSKDALEMSDIDLTQSSGSIDIQRSPIDQIINLPCEEYNNLGKIGDVSIDYDEVCIETANDYCLDEQFDDIQSKYGTSSSNVTVLSKNSMENSKNNLASSYSNTSEVFKLSDRELNYSLCESNIENLKSGDISIKDNIFNLDDSNKNASYKSKRSLNRSLSDSCLPSVTFKDNVNTNKQTEKYIKLNESIHSTPIKAIIKDDKISVQTPTNSEYVIKVREVTPMLDYAAMSSPERNKELEKYGLKPFKRKRAIQLLTHLYNQTHPIVEYCSEEPIPAKKLKSSSPNKNTKSPKKKSISPVKSKPIESINTGIGKENEVFYKETKDLPDIRDIECSSDDWVFQKREKAKVHSCRVPLHIAFHNYVSCRRGLREAILRYEPVNIDVIHKDLVSYGYRYNPKDLLRFLDKKCITVKTADNNARNSRK